MANQRGEELTDEQWTILAPLVPEPPRRGEAVRGGIPGPCLTACSGSCAAARWQDLPERFPPYQTCHRRFQQWSCDGAYRKLWPKTYECAARLIYPNVSLTARLSWRKKGLGSCSGATYETVSSKFCVQSIYESAEELLEREHLDFLDIVIDPKVHVDLVHIALKRKIPVVCQKPIAPSLDEAEDVVHAAQTASAPFFVHENWRWQTPIRKVRELLASGIIGHPFRARIRMVSAFPVFENQPFLKQLQRFLVADIRAAHSGCRTIFVQ